MTELETVAGSGATHEHGEHHGPTLKTFFIIFLALAVLTAISFTSARVFAATPVVSWTIMMAISSVKAMLVISFFMHLIWEANWKYVLTIPASVMSLLLVLLLVPDIGRRTKTYSEERWRHAAVPSEDAHKGHEPKETDTDTDTEAAEEH
jgi:cytochrome c oxidase subunit 4